jgi:RNA recognition motif-containing protein
MKMINGENNVPKGFGFCTYNDPDTAASAIRNMNKLTINNRDLSVNYASDKQSSTVLLPEDVRDRDKSEIITAGEKGEMLEPHTSTVDEMLRNLSDD